MADVIPRGRFNKLAFFLVHRKKWAENRELLGLSEAEIAELDDLVDAADEAWRGRRAAASAARSATQSFNQKLSRLSERGAAIVKKIKSRAASTGDEKLFSLAEIPKPADGSVVPPPGKATGFRARLLDNGALRVSWTCKNPRRSSTGILYQVSRALGANGRMELLGITGAKKFTDETLPAGAGEVTYQIRAVRSTALGPPAQYTVKFGGSSRAGSGAAANEIFEPAPMRRRAGIAA